jgi:hypothetical protein
VLHKIRPIASKTSDSFMLDVVILSEKTRRIAARCEEELVVYDYDAGKRIGMPDWMSAVFEKILAEQEQLLASSRAKAIEVDTSLAELETVLGYGKD